MRIRRDDSDAGEVGLAAAIDTRRGSMKPRPPADGLRRKHFEPLRRSAYRRACGILAGLRAIADMAPRVAHYVDADAHPWINLTARQGREIVRQASGWCIERAATPQAA